MFAHTLVRGYQPIMVATLPGEFDGFSTPDRYAVLGERYDDEEGMEYTVIIVTSVYDREFADGYSLEWSGETHDSRNRKAAVYEFTSIVQDKWANER